MGGSFAVEWVAALRWNQWQKSVEYALIERLECHLNQNRPRSRENSLAAADDRHLESLSVDPDQTITRRIWQLVTRLVRSSLPDEHVMRPRLTGGQAIEV